jgi:hypothetical protein
VFFSKYVFKRRTTNSNPSPSVIFFPFSGPLATPCTASAPECRGSWAGPEASYFRLRSITMFDKSIVVFPDESTDLLIRIA